MVKVTQKETIESTVKQLIDKFNDMLKKFKQHLFNIRHQFEQYRYAKTNLCCNERIIHVDFNENFSCKYSAEIQSVHFGSSHRQVTLHNGVFYVMKNQSLCDTCFCTISDCKEHEPFAIWSYMDPVLKLIRKRNPPIDTVHFFSVSPATQYRQKLNFYLLSTLVHTYGFQHATWNFSEAGHRKGAADGVGGALKRTADRLISLHYDISTPRLMYEALTQQESSIYVSEQDVHSTSVEVSNLSAIPGTMNIHQIILLASEPGSFLQGCKLFLC